MYKIKCSNGKYVYKTTYGFWVEFTKKGKVFNTLNIATKNLKLCQKFSEKSKDSEYHNLTYEIESFIKNN